MTLQDVIFQLGLHVDGDQVSGCTSNWETHMNRDIQSFCRELLGVLPMPEEIDMQRYNIKLNWFRSVFPTLDVDASNKTVASHTRACILL